MTKNIHLFALIVTLPFLLGVYPPAGVSKTPFYLLSKVDSKNVITKVAGRDVSSRKRFWPASSIKILPALAAVHWAADKNATVDSNLTIKGRRRWKGTLRKLIRESITYNRGSRASNRAYDRLIRIVGMDYLNRKAKKWGLNQTWISKAYASRRSLRWSPSIRIEGKKAILVKVSPNLSMMQSPLCKSNCTSLGDLQKMLLLGYNNRILRPYLENNNSMIKTSLRKRFGRNVKIYSKDGFVSRHHAVANALVVDGNKKVILTMVLKTRYRIRRRAWRRTKRFVNRLARKILRKFRN